MSEFRDVLLKDEVSEFDCGNPTINEYIANSYFATLSQQCYAYQIIYKACVVGYYMITLRDVVLSDCPSDISDYQDGEFGEHFPSLYINYLAVNTKYQKNGIGTLTLKKIINETKQLTNILPIRFITINSVPEKVNFYKKIGFYEMGKNIDNVNTYMYIDCIKNRQKLVDYCDERLSQFM